MITFTRTLLVAAALLVPVMASAAVAVSISFGSGSFCTTTICGVAQNILYLINNVLVPLLFAVAFITFLWYIFRYFIYGANDEADRATGRKVLLWGLIAFVVMISLWGLVNVLANTFGLAGVYAPPTPSSISPYGSTGGVYGQPPPVQYIECPKDAKGNCL